MKREKTIEQILKQYRDICVKLWAYDCKDRERVSTRNRRLLLVSVLSARRQYAHLGVFKNFSWSDCVKYARETTTGHEFRAKRVRRAQKEMLNR